MFIRKLPTSVCGTFYSHNLVMQGILPVVGAAAAVAVAAVVVAIHIARTGSLVLQDNNILDWYTNFG